VVRGPMEMTMGAMAKRILARLGIWRSDVVQTVPPELAACEYDCPKKECDDAHFENCERRLHTAEVLRAEAHAQEVDGAERPEPCVAPTAPANDPVSVAPQVAAR
jgi:hypothetical protein